VEDPLEMPPIDVCTLYPVDAEKDIYAYIMFGISSWLGLGWWFVSMFYYQRTYNNLKGMDGLDTLPIFWFWAKVTNP